MYKNIVFDVGRKQNCPEFFHTLRLYLDIQLVFVRPDVDERHGALRSQVVLRCRRQISSWNVRVTEQVDLCQLSIDKSPGVNDGGWESVTPKNVVLLRLANDTLGYNGFDLSIRNWKNLYKNDVFP